MITQAEFERVRQLRGKFINYWLDGTMTTDELRYMIEDVSHKRIVEPEVEYFQGVDCSSVHFALISMSKTDHIMVPQV